MSNTIWRYAIRHPDGTLTMLSGNPRAWHPNLVRQRLMPVTKWTPVPTNTPDDDDGDDQP